MMARQLNDAEVALASQLFSLADAVSAASQTMAVKKQEFTTAQSALRIAEADFQKAQEAMASFMKQNIGQASS
jgi:sulfur relay (sulfurtransferase) complex TusBCD TusD component (DsrE family)